MSTFSYAIQVAFCLCLVSFVLAAPSPEEDKFTIQEPGDDEIREAPLPPSPVSPGILHAASSSRPAATDEPRKPDRGKKPIIYDDTKRDDDDDDDDQPDFRPHSQGGLSTFGGRQQLREQQEKQDQLDLSAFQDKDLITDAARYQEYLMRILMDNLIAVEMSLRNDQLTRSKNWIKALMKLAECSQDSYMTASKELELISFLSNNPVREKTLRKLNELKKATQTKMDYCIAWETSGDTPESDPEVYATYLKNLKEMFELDEISQLMLGHNFEVFIGQPERRKLVLSMPDFRAPEQIADPEPIPEVPGSQNRNLFFDSLLADDDEEWPEWSDSYVASDSETEDNLDRELLKFIDQSHDDMGKPERSKVDNDQKTFDWRVKRTQAIAPPPGPAPPKKSSFADLQAYFSPPPSKISAPRRQKSPLGLRSSPLDRFQSRAKWPVPTKPAAASSKAPSLIPAMPPMPPIPPMPTMPEFSAQSEPGSSRDKRMPISGKSELKPEELDEMKARVKSFSESLSKHFPVDPKKKRVGDKST